MDTCSFRFLRWQVATSDAQTIPMEVLAKKWTKRRLPLFAIVRSCIWYNIWFRSLLLCLKFCIASNTSLPILIDTYPNVSSLVFSLAFLASPLAKNRHTTHRPSFLIVLPLMSDAHSDSACVTFSLPPFPPDVHSILHRGHWRRKVVVARMVVARMANGAEMGLCMRSGRDDPLPNCLTVLTRIWAISRSPPTTRLFTTRGQPTLKLG